MPAFNARALGDYIDLRGPLGAPSRELSAALKLRFLQSIQDVRLGDVAAQLPALLPGSNGQEALGAVSRRVRAVLAVLLRRLRGRHAACTCLPVRMQAASGTAVDPLGRARSRSRA